MSNYKLFYMSGACSMAVHVLLEELGQTFTLVKGRDATGNKTPELMAANPRGKVPVLQTADGHIIREGGAILSWLCDTHAQGQSNISWPASGNARSAAQEWLAFANATLHPAYGTSMMLKRANAPAELQQAQMQTINALWADVEAQLGKTPYITGEQLTPADILLTVIANWQAYITEPVQFGPNTTRLFKAVTSRPSYQKALQVEEVTYKAAA